MNKVGFYIKSKNEYQYFIPLEHYLSLIGIIPIFFLTEESDYLYNSNIDILFSIDCDYPSPKIFKNRKFKHIIIQNYHDFSLSLQREETMIFYKESDILWCEDYKFGKIAKDLGYKGQIISGILPNYWDFFNKNIKELHKKYNIKNDEKIAVCFLPRENEIKLNYFKNLLKTPTKKEFSSGNPKSFIEHANKFCLHLEENGYKIFFKQRKNYSNRDFIYKNNYIETDEYYPNASLELSYLSKFGFGYMTSALMHYKNFGINYINFDNKNYPEILKKMFSLTTNVPFVKTFDINKDFNSLIDFSKINFNSFKNLKKRIKISQNKIKEILN